jgi:FixJ family two-component response regulator
MKNQMVTSVQCRPVVYVAVDDRACRAAIVDALHRQGWEAIEYPTGYHLIEATADLIDGRQPVVRPGLIVVDAMSRGCSGMTIAAGLRDLDVRIPVVIVARPGDAIVDSDDPMIRVVHASHAASAVAELARPLSPVHVLDCLDTGPPQPRATS